MPNPCEVLNEMINTETCWYFRMQKTISEIFLAQLTKNSLHDEHSLYGKAEERSLPRCARRSLSGWLASVIFTELLFALLI